MVDVSNDHINNELTNALESVPSGMALAMRIMWRSPNSCVGVPNHMEESQEVEEFQKGEKIGFLMFQISFWEWRGERDHFLRKWKSTQSVPSLLTEIRI